MRIVPFRILQYDRWNLSGCEQVQWYNATELESVDFFVCNCCVCL